MPMKRVTSELSIRYDRLKKVWKLYGRIRWQKRYFYGEQACFMT
jgi:hypothetical protein